VDLVLLPGFEPVAPKSPDGLQAVVDARPRHPAFGRVPDDLRIEELARYVASRREALGELLDDLHVLLRHRRAVSRVRRTSIDPAGAVTESLGSGRSISGL